MPACLNTHMSCGTWSCDLVSPSLSLRMLEEMDKELDHTDSRLKALTSRVQTAIRKSGGKRERERIAYRCVIVHLASFPVFMYGFVSVIISHVRPHLVGTSVMCSTTCGLFSDVIDFHWNLHWKY